MEQIKVGQQKIKKMGTIHYITVPKKLIQVGILDLNLEYKILLIPVQEKENEKPVEVSQ